MADKVPRVPFDRRFHYCKNCSTAYPAGADHRHGSPVENTSEQSKLPRLKLHRDGKRSAGAWKTVHAARARANEILGTDRHWLLFHSWVVHTATRDWRKAELLHLEAAEALKTIKKAMRGLNTPVSLPPRGLEAPIGSYARAVAEFWSKVEAARAALRDVLEAGDEVLYHCDYAREEMLKFHGLEVNNARDDRLRKAVLRSAIQAAVQLDIDTAGFKPAGLAYFALSVGLDCPPRARNGKDEQLSASQVFRRDNVKRWQRILGEVLREDPQLVQTVEPLM